MLASEGNQDFYHSRVVSARIARNPLQRVDSANSNIHHSGTQLLNRFHIAIRHLTLTRKPEIESRVYERPRCEHTGTDS